MYLLSMTACLLCLLACQPDWLHLQAPRQHVLTHRAALSCAVLHRACRVWTPTIW